MAKVFNFVLILMGLLLLLAFAGFPTASHEILKYMGVTTTMDSTGAISGVSISGIMAVLFLATIASIFVISMGSSGSTQIGTFVINTTDSRIVAYFCSLFIVWVELDLYSIFSLTITNGYPAFVSFITALIIFPMMAAFGIALAQWWRGADI